MAFNPFDPALFAVGAPCLPCCAAPGVCACALLIPPGNPFPPGSPYASYADALAAVSDPLQVASCVAYFFPESAFTTGSSATIGTNMLTMNQAFSAFSQSYMWSSVNLVSGDTFSIAMSGTKVDPDPSDPAGLLVNVYSCDGTLIFSDNISGVSSHTFSFTVPANDAYTVIAFFAGNFAGTAGWTATQTVLSAPTLFSNPVIALWDDSGTTRQLWACPKLEIPPLAESTGTWYATSGDAATAISTLTSSCVGFIESLTNVASFTATDGGTSLTLAQTLTVAAKVSPIMWGGVNAVNGQTITVTAAVGAGTAGLNVSIYDDTGTLVQSSGPVSSPWTSSALPYKGRYTIKVAVTSTSNTTSMSAVITSSGTLSVNPIQALWNDGLDCPARTNC